MELNAEINKIFGQEMAKVFAATISEEEMMREAKSVWREMCTNNGGWYSNETGAKKVIKGAIIENLKKELEKLTNTDEFRADMEVIAKQMVEEIKEATRKKIVDEVSSRMAALSYGYNGYGLRSMVQEICAEMMQR